MRQDYFAAAREPRYSLSFALPLLLLYEALSLALSGSAFAGVRNGADVLLKSLFVAFGGRDGLALFTALLIGTGGVLVWRDRRLAGTPLRGRVFAWMLAESAVYALAFGYVVGGLTALLLEAPRRLALQAGPAALDLPTQLVISLGAGIYEELLFRVLLTGGLVWCGWRLLAWRRSVAVIVGVVVSALIFSAFHYVGALGDEFTIGSFTFRAIAGVAFSVLYVTRGLGITAWTHALYDVWITLVRG
jgi:hypothetical protein